MAEKQYKTIKDMVKNGAIMQAYGSTHFVTVTLAPQISKVRFSIVKMGTGGNEHVDFYLDMEESRDFFSEISSGKASEKFAKDIEKQYPEAYKYVAGTDGSKALNIGGGKKGIRFQINVKEPDGKWKNSPFTVAPWKELKHAAFLFELLTGLIPVMGGSYYHSIFKAFWDGEQERSKFFKDYDEKKDGNYNPETAEEQPAPTEEKPKEAPKTTQNEEKSTVRNEEKAPEPPSVSVGAEDVPEAVPEKTETSNSQTATLKLQLKVKIPLTDYKGGKCLKAVSADGEEYSVLFANEQIAGMRNWNDAVPKLSKEGTMFSCEGAIRNDKLYVKSIA